MIDKHYTVLEMEQITDRPGIESLARQAWKTQEPELPSGLDYLQMIYYLAVLQRRGSTTQACVEDHPWLSGIWEKVQRWYPDKQPTKTLKSIQDFLDAQIERFSYDFSEGCTHSISPEGKICFREGMSLDLKLRSLDINNRDGDPTEPSRELDEDDLQLLTEIKRLHPNEEVDQRFQAIQAENDRRVLEFDRWEKATPLRGWNWQLPDWPNFYWDQATIQKSLDAVSKIENLATAEIFDSEKHDIDLLREWAQIQTIRASSQIEGISYTFEETQRALQNPPRQNDIGHNLSGMAEITKMDSLVNPTENNLKDAYSWLCPGHSARYRFEPIFVVSGSVGQYKVHFQAPPAEALDQEMPRLLEFIKNPATLCGENPPAILVAAIAHFWFETLHPFDDGNGRIGRALADKILCKPIAQISSLSKQILKEQKGYYRQFEKHQGDTLDLTAYLVWFLQRHEDSIQATLDLADHLLKAQGFQEQMNLADLNAKQRKFLDTVLEPDFTGNLNPRKYVSICKVNKQQACEDLLEMERLGLIVQITSKPSYQVNLPKGTP